MFGFYQLLYKITNDENIWYAIGQGIVWYSVRKKWISEFSQKIADVRFDGSGGGRKKGTNYRLLPY